jgi:hypothetical protein
MLLSEANIGLKVRLRAAIIEAATRQDKRNPYVEQSDSC